MGPGGVGFNSDRADLWDGSTWSFVSWGEHTFSEPRHLMGSAAIEITLGEVSSCAFSCAYVRRALYVYACLCLCVHVVCAIDG